MADREDKTNLPPIPDGGLTDSMPDWLRRPPAWRTLSDREVTAPEPDAAAELPEADDSVIDPRTFLSDDDLPAWLKTLGPGRGAHPSAEPEDAAPEVDVSSSSREVAATGRQPEPTPSRFVPITPPAAESAPSSRDAGRGGAFPPPSRSGSASPPPWQGAWIVALLSSLLLIAVAVIIVLVL